MAKLTQISLFWRAFFLSLIFGTSAAADPEDEAAWAAARAANTAEAFYLYLSRFPAGLYVDAAVESLGSLGAIRGVSGGAERENRDQRPPSDSPAEPRGGIYP